MGDRRQVIIKNQWDENEKVYLYTHWGGYNLTEKVQAALKKRWRWNDSAYLARIIFEEMIGNQRGTETGFGISANSVDSNRPDITVDTCNQTISIGKNEWTFADYIGVDPANFDNMEEHQ